MNRRALVIALTAAAAATAAAGPRPANWPEAAKLAAEIQRQTPTPWSVTVSGRTISLTRQVVGLEMNSPPGSQAGPLDYLIAIEVGPRIVPSRRAELRQRRAARLASLARLERQMESFACDALDAAYEDACYRPRTAPQRRLLARHDRLRAQVPVVPDYFVDDAVAVTIGVSLAGGRPSNFEYNCDDCDRVRAVVTGLLTAYE